MDIVKFSYYVMAIGIISLLASASIYWEYKPNRQDLIKETLYQLSGEEGKSFRSAREWSQNKPTAIWAGIGGGVLLILGVGLNASSPNREERRYNTGDTYD